jgi:hypothetical protein
MSKISSLKVVSTSIVDWRVVNNPGAVDSDGNDGNPDISVPQVTHARGDWIPGYEILKSTSIGGKILSPTPGPVKKNRIALKVQRRREI